MRKTLIFYFIIAVLFVSIMVIFANLLSNRDLKESEKYGRMLANEYVPLLKGDSLFTHVIDVYESDPKFRIDPDLMRITVSSYQKYGIQAKYCLNSKDIDLRDVLNIGDSIAKAPNSDTLRVINKEGKFLFILYE